MSINFGSNAITSSSGGRWTLLGTSTASAASSISFTLDTGSYSKFKINMDEMTFSTEGTEFHARLSTDGGSTFESSSLHSMFAEARRWGQEDMIYGAHTDTSFQLVNNVLGDGTTGQYISGDVYLEHAGDSDLVTKITALLAGGDRYSEIMKAEDAGFYRVLEAHDAFKLYPSTGTMTGSFKIYGSNE